MNRSKSSAIARRAVTAFAFAIALVPIATLANIQPVDAVKGELANDGIAKSATILSIKQSGASATAIVQVGDASFTVVITKTSNGWHPAGSIGGAADAPTLQKHNVANRDANRLAAGKADAVLLKRPTAIHPPYRTIPSLYSPYNQ